MNIPEKLRHSSFSSTPFLVSIEGPDGVGKTTLCNKLALKKMFSHQPMIQEFNEYELKKRMIFEASWMSSAMFFLSGVMEIRREIETNEQREIVLMDRSFWSTVAVNWVKDKSRLTSLFKLLSLSCKFLPIPNLIIVLVASYEQCRKRSNTKKDYGKALDKVSYENYQKELEFYHFLYENLENVILLDTNNKTQDEVIASVEEIIINQKASKRS